MVSLPSAGPAHLPVRADGCSDPPAPARVSLIDRVVRVIEREMDSIEQLIDLAGSDDTARAEAERHARMIGSLTHTLTELKKACVDDDQRSERDDDRPRDFDELRQRLSQRLARKLGGGPAVFAGGHDESGTGLSE